MHTNPGSRSRPLALVAGCAAAMMLFGVLVVEPPPLARADDAAERVRVADLLARASVAVRSGSSRGTGFAIDEERWIATNAHVVRSCRCRSVTVTTHDECQQHARVVAFERGRDLAILESVERLSIPALRLGDSDDVAVGESVLAYGHPFGLDGTLSHGIVSARRNWGGIEDMLQTDAPIHPGSSGGPLVDLEGRVLGVTSSIFPGGRVGHGIGFAVPSNAVRELLRRVRDERLSTARQRPDARCVEPR